MTDLVSFLCARLDEDERTARAPLGDHAASWTLPSSAVVDTGAADLGDEIHTGDARLAEHIARHDPARVLREVEAARRVLDRHDQMDGGGCAWCWDKIYGTDTSWPCPDVRDVATRYADHPDYRDEWAPTGVST